MSTSERRTSGHLPSDDEVLSVLRRRGCLSLRELASELWPTLRWRPLHEGEDSIADAVLDPFDGMTRALWLWEAIGRLMARRMLRVCGADQNEVDDLAAVSIEVLGRAYSR